MIEKYLNKVIEGDCLSTLAKIPSDSVDMTFADPPFNLNKKYNKYADTKEQNDYVDWCNAWIGEMVRVTKPSGAIFLHNIPRWLSYYATYLNTVAYFKHWIVWDSGGSPMGKTLLPNHYGILFYTKSESYKDFKFYDIRREHPKCRACHSLLKDYGGKKHLAHRFGPLLSDVWNDIHRIRHTKRRDIHPCQLPVPLLERLILMTTDENDIVLDPFMGTGTTAVAATKLGRQYIGMELDPEYLHIAEQNVKEAVETKIGHFFVSIYLGKIKTIRNIDFDQIIAGCKDIPHMGKKIDNMDRAMQEDLLKLAI